MTFTPPEYKPPSPPEWATHVARRTPQFKVHGRKSDAVCALRYETGYQRPRGGTLYRLVDGEWTEVEHVKPWRP